MAKTKISFADWMKAVDAVIGAKACGLTSIDLVDCCYADWYEDGVAPKAAAMRALKNAGW